MKYRAGHVSNSSSSSFIVRFPKDPQELSNLKEMMGDCGTNPFGYAISTNEVVETVYKCIVGKEPTGPYEFDEYDLKWHVQDMISNMGGNGYGLSEEEIDKLIEMEKAHRIAMFEEAMGKPAEGGFVYRFEFSDNDGQFWSAMEHGNVFRNVEHIKQSNH